MLESVCACVCVRVRVRVRVKYILIFCGIISISEDEEDCPETVDVASAWLLDSEGVGAFAKSSGKLTIFSGRNRKI